MDLSSVGLIAVGLLAFSLLSGRLRGTVLTAPLVFVVFGYAIGVGGFGVAEIDPGHGVIQLIAEVTLILVLFSDAARMDWMRLRRDHNLPLRMLVIGLPLVIIFGALVAQGLFPEFSVWEAALLAAILAPTDAALGQSVVSDRAVPVRIRQTINVESGLNDGIALPAVLLFAALASTHDATNTSEWVRFGLLQLILGPLAGVVLGYIGARALDTAAERGWSSTSFQGIGILSLTILTFVVAELIGGNGFIAAFVGGLVFGSALKHPCLFLYEFMESEGELLILITFLLFGAVLLPEAIEHLNGATILYAVLSLTVIRMLPIALSLIGTGVRLPTLLFLGWFGPRGLASILFALLLLEKAEVVRGSELLSITVATVALSVLLHGVTAAPFAKIYGRITTRMREGEEDRSVHEMPLRHGPTSASPQSADDVRHD
ncbi:MAG: hypothetical protein GXP16_17505 [Gammaproteobacteria bacterium]|nr:hypothetical protein [Gammaproteobacteria bacterium]